MNKAEMPILIEGWSKSPWTLERESESSHQVVLSSPDWYEFASVVVRMHGKSADNKTGLANACLIAAAPRLYQALERAVTVLNPAASFITDREKKTVMMEAQTALAEARGQANLKGRKFVHAKSENRRDTYTILFEGFLQIEDHAADMLRVVTYQDSDGKVWTRPATEFFDGRFKEVVS